MGKVIMVTGGARSGKSGYAESIAKEFSSVGYIATAVATDDEMVARIKRHQSMRPKNWHTYERYREIDSLILNAEESFFMLECLGTLVTNYLMDASKDKETVSYKDATMIEKELIEMFEDIIKSVQKTEKTLVLVTNEVGLGIVPLSALARMFQDLLGRLNQHVAALSDEVVLMVSGIPLKVKG
jgi:adenosylcobinamide kinase/adenosylcobinamide-phosphate guanylyltransferase